MLGIVDRFEGKYRVVEVEDRIYNAKKDILEEELKEGDVVNLEIRDGIVISIKKNIQETQKRKEYIKKMSKDMWN